MNRRILGPLLVAGLALGTFAPLAGDMFFVAALPEHFRPQLGLLGTAVVVFLLATRRWVFTALAVALVGVNVVPLLPYAPPYPAPPTDAPTLRVMTFNMHRQRTDPARFTAHIRALRPDVLLLTETPADLDRWIGPLADWSVRIDLRVNSPFGLFLLSRWPVRDMRVDDRASVFAPVLVADLAPRGDARACLRLVGLHAARPMPAGGRALQARQVAAAVGHATGALPVVVMGDLNAAPWSRDLAPLRSAGLRDGALGFGLWSSWQSPVPGLGLPIDHVLVGPGVGVSRHVVGPALGSDHHPVSADLHVTCP